MRKRFETTENNNIGLRANVYVGTRVVVFGFNVNNTTNLLGFSIERFNPATQERKMMQGYKIFPSTGRGIPRGTPVDSDKHPFQSFQWSDYGSKPDTTYQYTITALGGTPSNLKKIDQLVFSIKTMTEDFTSASNASHVAVFNSGVAGSQAFSNKFPQVTNIRDSQDPEVWNWLSRGLKEAILSFISQATDSTYALYGAFYEFQNEDVLGEFKKAFDDRNVDVKLVISWKDNPKKNEDGSYDPPDPRESNRKSLKNIGVTDPENCDWIILRTKTKSYLQHNKFLILLKDGVPQKLLTGSTNITDNGIFGQSNVVHATSDKEIANLFYEYWKEMKEDPERGKLYKWVENNNPLPDIDNFQNGTYLILSPREDEAAIDFYAELINRTDKAAFITQAFTIHKKFVEVLGQDLNAMRFVLLDKFDSRFESDYKKVDSDYDVELAVGSRLPNGAYQRWVKEIANNLGRHVNFMHLKVILIDPAGNEPILLTGSANYSKNSTMYNDENTLLMKGDTDIADIYLGELARLFNHHYFRYLQNKIEDNNSAENIAFLAEKPEGWIKKYETDWNLKYKKRYYFCP